MHFESWPPQSMIASTSGWRNFAPATWAVTSLTWKSNGMNRRVSSTIWLPVTTIASTSLNEIPAARRNSSASFFTEPPLQQPHAEQWPVQATLPLSTGWVRR